MEINLEKYLKQFKDICVGRSIPLIKWDHEWPVPDKFKIVEYQVKKKFKGNTRKLLRYRLLGRIEKSENKPITKKWYRGDNLRGGLKYVYKNGYIWVVLKSNWPSQLISVPLKFTVKNGWWQLLVPENSLGVWFIYGMGRINFTVVPKAIKLNDAFWETFGILYGEMTRKSHGIVLANTEPSLLNDVLNFFDKTQVIDKGSWSIVIAINSKNIPIKNRKYILKQAKKYWYNQLDIKDFNIKGIYWCNWNTTLNPNFGMIELRFGNLALRKVIGYLIKFVEKEATQNKEYATAFLRGLMAGEGGFCAKNNGIQMIRVASNLKSEREFYKRICKSAGLEACLYKNRHNVHIMGIRNFIKAWKMDIFKLHSKRKKRFLKCYNNSHSIRILNLLTKKPMHTKEIMASLNLNNLKATSLYLGSMVQYRYIIRKRTEYGPKYIIGNDLKELLNNQPFNTPTGIN